MCVDRAVLRQQRQSAHTRIAAGMLTASRFDPPAYVFMPPLAWNAYHSGTNPPRACPPLCLQPTMWRASSMPTAGSTTR